jgi:phage shock protein C
MSVCRSTRDRRLAGVCGGLADHLGWSSSRLRVVWVLATVFTAFSGLIVYLALWYLMPPLPPEPLPFEPAPLRPWRHST